MVKGLYAAFTLGVTRVASLVLVTSGHGAVTRCQLTLSCLPAVALDAFVL